MGTRGAIGILVNGQTKAAYNHFDSYPSGLGRDFAEQALALSASLGIEGLRSAARSLEVIDTEIPPTPEQIEHCATYTNLSVSERSTADWYCLLREAQGDLRVYLDLGVIPGDGADFMKDSLFCEHAYILNLDGEEPVLEYYAGFQTKPHSKGRYATRKPRGWRPGYAGQKFYYPVALAASIPLSELVAHGGLAAEAFVSRCEEMEV
jgi:hypothetical protein